jgi:hypothetical protein
VSAVYLFESLRAGADKGSDEVLAQELALVRFSLALVHVCSKIESNCFYDKT